MENNQNKKICKCGETDISKFGKNKTTYDGLQCYCKKCKILMQKEYYNNNIEKVNTTKKKYYEKNKVKTAKYQKEYGNKNKELLSEKKREYYKNNKKTILKNVKDYRNTPKGKIVKRNSENKRRAIIKSSRIDTQLLEKLTTSKFCYWCNRRLTKFHIDHYQPLSNGGLHTLENLVISCPACNLKKSNKDPIKFANSVGKLL